MDGGSLQLQEQKVCFPVAPSEEDAWKLQALKETTSGWCETCSGPLAKELYRCSTCLAVDICKSCYETSNTPVLCCYHLPHNCGGALELITFTEDGCEPGLTTQEAADGFEFLRFSKAMVRAATLAEAQPSALALLAARETGRGKRGSGKQRFNELVRSRCLNRWVREKVADRAWAWLEWGYGESASTDPFEFREADINFEFDVLEALTQQSSFLRELEVLLGTKKVEDTVKRTAKELAALVIRVLTVNFRWEVMKEGGADSAPEEADVGDGDLASDGTEEVPGGSDRNSRGEGVPGVEGCCYENEELHHWGGWEWLIHQKEVESEEARAAEDRTKVAQQRCVDKLRKCLADTHVALQV